MPLPIRHDGAHEVAERRGGGAVEHGARLHDRWRGAEVAEFVPPHAVASAAARGGAGGVHLNLMGGPQPAVADDGLQQSVVEAIERVGRNSRIDLPTKMRNVGRDGSCRHVHDDVAREAGRCRGIRDAAHDERAEARVVHADEVALVGVPVEVVYALRRVDPATRAVGQSAIKLRHRQRASRKRRLVQHVERRRVERERVCAGAAELVDTDVERILVETQRGIVAQAGGGAAHAALRAGVGPLKERPLRAEGNRGAVAHGHQGAVRHGHVDDDHEPAAGTPVVAHARVRRAGASVDAGKERVEISVEHAVGDAGALVDGTDAAVHAHEVLGGPHVAHGVWRQGAGVGQRGHVDGRRRHRVGHARVRAAIEAGRHRVGKRRGILRQVATVGTDLLKPRTVDIERHARPTCGLGHDLAGGAHDGRSADPGLCRRIKCRHADGAVNPGDGRRPDPQRSVLHTRESRGLRRARAGRGEHECDKREANELARFHGTLETPGPVNIGHGPQFR